MTASSANDVTSIMFLSTKMQDCLSLNYILGILIKLQGKLATVQVKTCYKNYENGILLDLIKLMYAESCHLTHNSKIKTNTWQNDNDDKPTDLYSTLNTHLVRCSHMACVNKGSHSFTCNHQVYP